MLRLFVLVNLLVLNLFACKGGYSSCIAKINDANVIQKNALFIPVKNNKLLVYSPRKPDTKILKYDPFLSLYLIEDRKKFAYPFDVNMRLQLGTAVVNAREAKEGKFLKNQVGLKQLAHYSQKLPELGLITSSCCSLEGIVTPDGVIQKEYIKRFLSKAPATYGDIGVRVQDEDAYVIVTASNPYLKNNPLQKGDCIVAFDGLKVKSASEFMKKVLFSKIGSRHTIRIKRDAKTLTFKLTSTQRYGGGDISDTFLELKGIYFNKKLQIMKISKHFREYGLLKGDRLLQVNGVTIKNQNELLQYIEDFKDFSSLLFERNGFQFFVNIK